VSNQSPHIMTHQPPQLPPLPAPAWISVDTPGADSDTSFFRNHAHVADFMDGEPAECLSANLFSADQMHAYATAAVQAALSSQAPAEVVSLVRFMQTAFVPMTTQQVEIRKALELAVAALQSRQPAAPAQHWTESEPVRLAPSRAGPMSGLPEFNFPAFNAEAAALRAQGFAVLNPAEHGIVDGADWADYLRHDIAGLASCERIHLLPGWSKSKGARLEHSIAVALGMVITLHPDAEPAAPVAAVPDGVWEALQLLIENGGSLGPASQEDALVGARHRDRVRFMTPPASQEQAKWCEYVAGMVWQWLHDSGAIRWEEDRCTKAIAGIIERRLWALKREDKASQEQAQPGMKDGEIATLVNKLRDIAIEFHGQQQLRERIAGLIVPVLKAAQPSGEAATVAIDNLHNDRRDERNLARLAVALVRAFGGVIEHPVASGLWADQKLPKPGQRDQYGGFTLPIDQH